MAGKALLVLQGGGAMGAFQCGAYQAIAEYLRREEIELVGVAGASIGAFNGGMIARHYRDPDHGAAALAAVWREALAVAPVPFFPFPGWYWNCWNGLLTTLLCGHPNISMPNYPAWGPWGDALRVAAPAHLTQRLERLAATRFGSYGPNPGNGPLLLVRAIDATSQRPAVFHSWKETVTARHIRASASVPLIYPFTEVNGRLHWDGDLWPRTPLLDLLAVLQGAEAGAVPSEAYLVIEVDTVSSQRRLPSSAIDIHFQTVAGMMESRIELDQRYAEIVNRYLDFVAEAAREGRGAPDSPLRARVAAEYERTCSDGLNRLDIVRIHRRALPYEYISRDFDYSVPRVERLIEQGRSAASEALYRHSGRG